MKIRIDSDLLAWLDRTVMILGGFALLVILLEHGYLVRGGLALTVLFRGIEVGLLAAFLAYAFVRVYLAPERLHYLERNWIYFAIPILLLILGRFWIRLSFRTAVALLVGRQIVLAVQRAARTDWGSLLILRLQTKPAKLLALSFLSIICLGTLFLTFPWATPKEEPGGGFVDALFTATSATCVTGLIVQDTPTYFSRFGQTVILMLIQIGGLGIMTISTSMALIFGRSMSMRGRRAMQEVMDAAHPRDLREILLYVVRMTFIAELAGFLLLLARWRTELGGIARGAYWALFHSVSAFCNAGFSLFSDSLIGYRGDLAVNAIVVGLIVLGGIGFVVVSDVLRMDVLRKGPRRAIFRISLHTRLALLVTFLLLSAGTISLFFFEFDNILLRMPISEKLLTAFFQSVTPRTAGFNTVDIASLNKVSQLLLIILMFIGASPGSTGGGIKTTTFGVLVLSVRSMLLGRREVEAAGRTIPREIVYKATSIVVISFSVVVLFLILLLFMEEAPFLDLLFETMSAFGTVGLSMGVTSNLTTPGKLAIILLMFTGRIGPLTLALAVGERARRATYRYPDGRVMVG